MERRMRTNLLLAAIVIALVLVIRLAPAPEQGATQYALVSHDEINRIEVHKAGVTQFALERDGESWHLREPVALPADPFHVNALRDALRERTTRRYPVAEVDLAELGLANPEWTLTVDGETLALGGRGALGQRRYVRKGDFVYLVSEMFTYRLQRAPMDYAAKRVLPADRQVAAIALPSGARIENADGGWTLEPEDASVSADDLQQLADAWRNASALSVTPANSVPRDGEVVIEFGDAGELRLGVEMTADELKLTRDAPAVTYTLPRAQAKELLELSSPAE